MNSDPYSDEIGEDPLDEDSGPLGRISARGEEAVTDAVQALLDNPVLKQALHAAFGARDLANSATGTAKKTLNVASGDEHDRLSRRVRSMSDRLEALEDQLDRLSRELAELRKLAASDGVKAPAGQERLGLSE